jgi:hypothetical protein
LTLTVVIFTWAMLSDSAHTRSGRRPL